MAHIHGNRDFGCSDSRQGSRQDDWTEAFHGCHREISEEKDGDARTETGSWTLKQELGYLMDSATNNHVRFVLAALEGKLDGPRYAQDD